MKRQATARWELARAERRRAFYRGLGVGVGGVLLGLACLAFLWLLFLAWPA